MEEMPHEHEMLDSSLRNLVSVLEPGIDDYQFTVEGSSLFRACKIIGHVMDLDFSSPGKKTQTLEEICTASQIRYRRVLLKDDWWKTPEDHYLAYYKDIHRPVALIAKKTHYEMIDPDTKRKRIVDQELVFDLMPIAYMFYVPLPKGHLHLLDFLNSLVKRHYKLYFQLIMTGLLASLAALFIPFANQVIYDHIIPGSNLSLYYQIIFGLLVIAISVSIFQFSRSFVILRLTGLISNRMQMGLWDRLLSLPLTFFRKHSSGDLIQRTEVFDHIRRNLNDDTLRVIANGFFSVLYLAIMFYYSWRLAIAGFAVAVVDIAISTLFFLIKLPHLREYLANRAKINTYLNQAINGIAKIRTAGAEARVFAHWAGFFSRNQKLNLRVQRLQTMATTSSLVLNSISSLLLFGIVIWMLRNAEDPGHSALTVGEFLAFQAAFFPFIQSLTEMSTIVISLASLMPFWERAKVIIQTMPEPTSEKNDPGELKGEVEINRVYFRFNKDEKYLLKDVSLHIKPGEFVGLIGHSGSGKSTLCRLIVGFNEPESGSILLDGKKLNELDLQKVRQQIGLILQTISVFGGTIYENLVCGKKYSKEVIHEALELSTFREELDKFPMGLDTLLTSGGGIISKGQLQKLLLTRILIQQPKILILDEATSALDNHSQKVVSENLSKLNMTRIVIAHRLSTLQGADRIVVFDKGEIVGAGTFEELKDQKGLFTEYLEKQSL